VRLGHVFSLRGLFFALRDQKFKSHIVNFFYVALRPNAGHGLLILEVF